jgi:ADP-ribose pyrophosphatase
MREEVPTPAGSEEIVYQGKIVEVVRRDMDVEGEIIPFEYARRAPGTRLIIEDEGEILLTNEYRHELKGRDYRLPGGKVFDSLDEYNKFETGQEIIPKVTEAAKREAREEAGIDPKIVEHYKKSHSGATVIWNLHYFIVKDFERKEQELEKGEDIQTEWVPAEKVKQMCLEGEIQEDRTAATLLQYLSEEGKI